MRSGVVTRVAGLALATLAACGGSDRATGITETSAAATTESTSTSATATTATPRTTIPAAPISAPETAPALPPTTTATASTAPVFEFADAAADDGWQVINDTVMGGVSVGELTWSAGLLSFTGELSLANNGGFASIRSPEIDGETASEWAARPGVRVEVEGDGRTWTLQLRTDVDSEGWISAFPTRSEGPTTVELPWATFEPVTRFLEPRSTDETLDPARISAVAFFLVDGIEGPFRLALRSIG